jgi:undecaprenyl diphosphate synthase
MGLFIQYLEKEIKNMQAEGVRLNVIGDISRFPQALQDSIGLATTNTAGNTRLTLNVAANYGGRWDILNAVQAWQAANPNANVADLDADQLNAYLSTAGQPEPDLLIRTGGESRISNFMLWQLAYAECYFTDTLWPDFDATELDKALTWFSGRERRFGSVVA